MLDRHAFNNYNAGVDPYAGVTCDIRLSDLEPKTDRPIKLSVLTSTYHRYSQLRRSLECLARQDWKDFEVLICDDGDTYDLTPVFQEFEPYLHLQTIRRERKQFHVDPTGGFRLLFPLAAGEVFALIQPEMMFHSSTCRILYEGHFQELPDSNRWAIGRNLPESETWVAIKPQFMSPDMQKVIDTVDWHSNTDNLQFLPNYWTDQFGLSNQSNRFWEPVEQFPWWFVGSAKREAKIFWDMPEFLGHASIDFYLLDYRRLHDYADIMPLKPLAYHQDHHRISVGVEGEQEEIGRKIQETLK